MNFDNEKKQSLSKIYLNDKSKKGSIDKEISDLIRAINSNPDYYTTSSCAGRIMVIRPAIKKWDALWIFQSHKLTRIEDLPLDKLPKGKCFLRMEPPILHICCRALENVSELLNETNKVGIRRCGSYCIVKKVYY